MKREEELIQRIKQGNMDAANELAGMYYAEILRYCLWHTPNRSVAEDAAQETFLKVIRYFDRYAHKGKFKSFLYQVTAHTCTDLWRKNKRFDVSLESLIVEPAYQGEELEEVQSDMALRQLVGNLPAELQEIVLLRFGQDLTLREIAETLHMPLRTVQTRLRSALKKLKTAFEKGEIS